MNASAWAAFLILWSAATVLAQQPTFSARLDAVRVDALVTEGGKIVRGLRATDFDVVDNGVAQQVDLASFEELPLNVVLAFDMSESFSGDGSRTFASRARCARWIDAKDQAGC